jgi:GntR family transcriptional regulator
MAEPKYRYIADDLRSRIESGALVQGEQLPTELELQEQYNASRNTIRDAIKRLTSLSLVETRAGLGTFVLQPHAPFTTTLSADAETGLGGGEGRAALSEIAAMKLTPSADIPDLEIERADSTLTKKLDVDLAKELSVNEGTQLISRYQQRYINGTPWSLQTSFYPMDLAMRGADRLLIKEDIKEGTVTYLKEKLGLVQVRYRDRIKVRLPNEIEAKFFKLPDDGRISVVVIYRTGYADDGKELIPFRVTISVFPADRNEFTIDVHTDLAAVSAKKPRSADQPA